MYDVIIIGSGPAGLTAAIYTVRSSLKTLLLAGDSWGGQLMLTTNVENFPGFTHGIQGPELMQNMRQQAENLGVEIVEKNAQEINVTNRPFVVKTNSGEYQANSLIITTGASTKWLGVPGEKELIGKGVSSCAPCDAFFFKDKKVAVVGGGDSAMEEALVLAKVANSVTIIHRRDEFRASKIMQDRVLNNPKIKVLWNTQVLEVLGKEKVIGLKLKESGGDKGGRVYDFPLDGVFVAIGHVPNSLIFKGKIEVDEKGYIKRKEILENGLLKYWSTTSTPGVFVAGDVHDYKYRQAVTAAGFGCMAAMDAERWLEENKS